MLMLAATNAGPGNLDHFSSLQVVSLSEVKRWQLKEYADVISELLAEFDRCFKEFNNFKPQFAHSLPLRLMWMQKAFPKNSRWKY